MSKSTKIAIYGLILCLSWSIVKTASWSVVDLLTKQVNHNIQSWQVQAVAQTTWDETHYLLKLALLLEPRHPDSLEVMGQLYYWHATSIATHSIERSNNYQKSLEHFLLSLTQRPASAYTWANIVILKGLFRDYDRQFFTAVKQAVTLGGWELFVQQAIAEVGLVAWQELPVKTRTSIVTAIEHGLQIKSKEMDVIVSRHQQLFCRTQELKRFCQ